MHNYRTEHWIVVSGIAKIEIEQNTFTPTKNQSTFMPLKSKHRPQPLTIIEIVIKYW